MKLVLGIGALAGAGALIGLGLVLAVKGSPWVLIASGLGYGVAFVRFGCATH
jgi:hypothetical protein